MITLIILYVIACLIVIVGIVQEDFISNMIAKTIVSIILVLAIGFGLLCAPVMIQTKELTEGSELIGVFDDGKLYYREDSDEYFAIIINNWNPLSVIEKMEIKPEVAIEKLQELNSISE